MKETSSIRIALCTSGEIWGGIETFVLSHAKELIQREGVELTCVLFEEGALARELRDLGLRVQLFTIDWKYDPRVISRLAHFFRTEAVNIVHTNGYKANILCGIAGKMSDIKLVKTDHGMLEPGANGPTRKMSFNLKVDKAVSHLTHDAVIFVSKDLEQRNKTRTKALYGEVIYNGVELSPRTDCPTDYERQQRDDAFRLCVIGRLDGVKGHIYLLGALTRLADLKDIQIFFYGEGPSEKKLKQFCSEHSIGNKVFFKGFIRDIKSELRRMHVLVMPSLHEGIPYTMLEAMALRIPIIASRVGGIKEILVDQVCALLVPPRDEVALAAAIRRIHEDPLLRERLAAAAYERVQKELRSSMMTDRYLTIYRKLLAL